MIDPIDDRNIYSVLLWMKSKGQSVLINWSEDDDLWECSWITGGIRHTGNRKDLSESVQECLQKAGALNDAVRASPR